MTNLIQPLKSQARDLPRLRGNHVLLRADSLRLLLPQDEVGAAEYLVGAPQPTEKAGYFAHGADKHHIIALSSEMRALDAFPAERFVLTHFIARQAEFFLAWNEMRVLINMDLEREALPAAMQRPGAPVDSYVKLDGHLTFCCTAESVAAWACSEGK
jgi:hypothetical protein